MTVREKALFLDRDGVINIDYGYVHDPTRFVFIDGIFSLVRLANEAGYRIIIVTNQAGIGRGYYSEEQFNSLMDWMQCEFLNRGGKIDAVYYCPYHPEYGIGRYLRESSFRKPNPGMILAARDDFNLDLQQSILVGDKYTDIAAGMAAGVGVNILFDANLAQDIGSSSTVSCLNEIARFL